MIIEESNDIYKRNTFNHFQLLGRYSSGTRFQLTNTTNVYNNKETDSTKGFLFRLPSQQSLFGKLFYLKNESKATYLINSKSLLFITDNVSYGTQPQQYAFSPLLADSIFHIMEDYNALLQNEKSKIANHSISLNYSRKIDKGNLRLELGHKSSLQKFYSTIHAVDSSEAKVNLNADFSNNVKFLTNELFGSVSFSSKIFDRLNYTLSIKANALKLSFDSVASKTYYSKTYILPSLSMNYSFSTNSELSFSYVPSENLPQMDRLYNGYAFTNFLRLEKGSGILRSAINHGFNLNYHSSDLVNKGLLFFSGLIFRINQSPYLTNLDNRDVYSFVQNDLYDGRISNSFLAAYSIVQKIIPAIKSQVTFNISANTGKSMTENNGILQTNKFNGAALKFEFRSAFEKKFNFVSSGSYSLNDQKNLPAEFHNTTHQVSLRQTLDYKIFKNLHLNSSISYLSAWSNLTETEHVILLNAGALLQLIPKKLSLMVSGNNLLNQKDFSSNSFTPFYSYTNRFQILRSFGTLNVQYKF